jgi:hypothetical protein
MTCGWSQVISGNPPTFANMQAWDARLEPLTWCQAADGLFYLNVDGLAEWPDIAGRLERGSAKADRLQKLMAQHAMASVAEGKQALREP